MYKIHLLSYIHIWMGWTYAFPGNMHTSYIVPYHNWPKAVSLNRPPPRFWTTKAFNFTLSRFVHIYFLFWFLYCCFCRWGYCGRYHVSNTAVPRAAKSYILLLTGPFKTSGIHQCIVYMHIAFTIYNIYNIFAHILVPCVIPNPSDVQRPWFEFLTCNIIYKI